MTFHSEAPHSEEEKEHSDSKKKKGECFIQDTISKHMFERNWVPTCVVQKYKMALRGTELIFLILNVMCIRNYMYDMYTHV